MRLHFINDIFVAVVVVLLKLPNVVMTETSYQMLAVLLFCDQERPLPPSLKITALKDNMEMTINADTVADAQRGKMLVNLAKLRGEFIRQ